jgi:hypothetical protein
MQIITPNLISLYENKNIPTTFYRLFPSPIAFKRGVKIISCPITEELDEGPIIEQDITRVSQFCRRFHHERFERTVLARAIKLHARKVMVYSNKTVIRVLAPPFRGKKENSQLKQHRKILTLMRVFSMSIFQPKLQFLLIENTHLSRTILPLHKETFLVFPTDQSNFQLHLAQSATLAHKTIHPVPKAKLPSDFVLLGPFPDICVTILFMVLCCCSADIILNKFPDWEK